MAEAEAIGDWGEIEEKMEKIKEELHARIDELGDMELQSIQGRTPWLTGALTADEYYIPHHDPDDDVLLELTVGTKNQVEN